MIEHPAAPGALSAAWSFAARRRPRRSAPHVGRRPIRRPCSLSGDRRQRHASGRLVYDYEARLVPSWPNGVHQRPALVGSVIRTVPHPAGAGQTRAGGYGLFIRRVQARFLEPRLVIPLPDATRAMLAGAGHRLASDLAHGSWRLAARIAHGAEARHPPARLGAGRAEQRRRCARRRRRLWADPHQRVRRRLLFMHRQMIKMVADSAGEAAPKPWAVFRRPVPS